MTRKKNKTRLQQPQCFETAFRARVLDGYFASAADKKKKKHQSIKTILTRKVTLKMRSVNVFSILMLTALMVAPTLQQADNITTTTNNNSIERKYPKQLYRLIQDRLHTNRRTLDQEGSWSEWTSWTPCSRTCGGGVSAQMRHCRTLRARRSATGSPLRNRRKASDGSDDLNNLNALDTATSIGGNSSSSRTITTGCVGLYKRYHMCNTQECPAGSPDFRQSQCESYNGKQFMGRYYIWEAYWDGENPCELNCRALTFRFYALLNKTVIDGTLCRPNDPTRVCVAGTCKTIGCDGIVGSDKRPDACGVCGGSNSTCQIVSGIFTEPQLPPGYNLVAQLPKGACHVNITEFKPSRNYLALRRSDGTFVFNGNWAINWSGEYQAAGTTFAYRRQDTTTPELITTQGPLTEPIDIMVIYQQINPGIKYEYMLPLGVANSNIAPRPNNNPSPSVQSDGLNGGTASSSIIVPPGRFHPDAGSNSPTATNFLGSNPPSPPRSLGSEGGLFQTIQQGSTAGLGGIHQQLPPPSSSGLSLSNPASSGVVPSSLSSSGSLATLGIAVPSSFDASSSSDHVINNNPSVLSGVDTATLAPAVHPNKETGRTAHQNHGGRSPNKRRQHGHRIHNKQGGGGAASSSAPGEQGKLGSPELQAIDPNVATPPPHRRGPRRHPNGKGFVWKQVGFSECSKTCGGGVQQALIVCVRDRDQVPVADHRCKEEDRPPSETVRCGPKPCPADWVLGEWTPCTVTCGDGIQTRDLTCKQEISPTLTMRVNEAACLGTAPSVPRVRNCNLGQCAKWHTSDWGKCSTSCGKGMRHRRVYCQGFDGRDVGESDCSSAEKPSSSDICDMGSCSANTWFFTEWTGQCSEECGTGIQTRKAHCSSNSETDCDVSKKPDTSRTCVSAKDCSGKWFAGPWSQCSATCDEGTQTREVICLTFMRGQYRVGLDMQCPARDKPNNTAPCNLGKCLPQWYTTDWSECSATCGTGAQRREVKCLDSNQMPSQDCREEDRPLLRQACNVRANCNEVPGNEENAMEAQDTPVISVESNRNNNETEIQEPVKPKKTGKVPKSSNNKVLDSAAVNVVTAAPAITGDGITTDASASASGEGCSDKFKNCHLVVQARLCKLKYYLVSCCASCSKPKT